jgi:hypothetical protein
MTLDQRHCFMEANTSHLHVNIHAAFTIVIRNPIIIRKIGCLDNAFDLVNRIWRYSGNQISIFDIYVTEYGTALITILPILFLYLNTVTVTAGTFEP